MKRKKNKNKGILFWITGLSGTGKSTIGNLIYPKIKKIYGPTIIIHGDDFRNIWNLNNYDYKSRYKNCEKYIKFCKYITDQNINVIFTVIGMFEKIRKWNRKNIRNYVEIYIAKKNYKNLKIKKKLKKNIVGIDIKAELPKRPDIKIVNNFNQNKMNIANNLIKEINLKF